MLNLTLIDADSIYFRQACVTKKQKDIRKGIDHVMNDIKRECLSDQLMVDLVHHVIDTLADIVLILSDTCLTEIYRVSVNQR